MIEGNKASLMELVNDSLTTEKEVTVTIGKGKVTFTVYPIISVAQKGRIIRQIYDFVFVDGADVIEQYNPSLTEFAIRYCVIKELTNLELPDNIEDIWKVLRYTDIFPDVWDVCGGALSEVIEDAKRLIDVRLAYLKNKTDINALVSKLTEKIGKMSMDLSDVDISKLIDMFQGLPKDGNMSDMVKAILNTQLKGGVASSVT